MTEVDTANRTAEERARVEIDRQLDAAGWAGGRVLDRFHADRAPHHAHHAAARRSTK